MDTLSKLRNSSELSVSEKGIVAYILDHPEEVTRISSRELARRTFTSPTAILRFSKKLGFQNFNDFKVNIASELKRAPMIDVDVTPNDNALTVMNKLAEMEENVIKRTRDKTPTDALQQAARLVGSASCVDICAADSLAALATYTSHLLMNEGLIATVYDDLDRMVHLALIAPGNHVAILIGRSGTDRTLCLTAKKLHERNVKVIALTANADSPLANHADVAFELFHSHGFTHLGEVVFATSAKYVLDSICALVYSQNYDAVNDMVERYVDLYYGELDRAADLSVAGVPPEVNEL